jgi:hypothetical protein
MDIGEVVMKKTQLVFNVFAAPIDNRPTAYINGKIAVDAMTSQILAYFEANYTTLYTSGIYIDDRINGVRVRDLSTIATRKHVYRNTFTLNITYEV